jgi:RND family efflux transporter MFP subunit
LLPHPAATKAGTHKVPAFFMPFRYNASESATSKPPLIPRNMRHLPLAAILLLSLAACDQTSPAPPAAAPLVTVDAKPWQELAVHPERSAPAQVVSLNESKLAAEISAPILALTVEAGETVSKNTVLVRLDPRDLELALARAEAAEGQSAARVKLAADQTRRARDLQARNFISPEALQQKETELSIAEADVKAARANTQTARRALEKTVLRAPFPAVIRSRHGQVGELATPGSPLLTLVDTSRVDIVAQISTADQAALSQASLRFVAPGVDTALTLLRVSPVIQLESRLQEVRLKPQTELPPGLEGKLVWQDAGRWLPPQLIVRRANHYGVFLLSNNTARFHALPEAQEGRPARADSLPVDALLITDGRTALQDGQSVQPATGTQ